LNGEPLGEVENIGFVEMDNKSKNLLFTTINQVIINIDMTNGIDYEEDPRLNILLNPLNLNKYYGKLFPEACRIRINNESKRAQIYGYEERSRVWQKVWRLESLPVTSVCKLNELK